MFFTRVDFDLLNLGRFFILFMDKGWGLALENSDRVGLFGNKSVFGYNLSPRLSNRSTMFPVDSSARGEHHTAAPPPLNEHTVVLGEVDFFSEKQRPIDHEVNGFVKKEINNETRELDVNVSVNL